MKHSAIVAALWLATAGVAVAQAPPPGPPPGGPPIEALARDLGLDDTQKAEMKRIFAAQRAKREAERAQFQASGTRPTREEMHAKHKENDAELRQQLSTVLSAEQLARFETLRKERRPHGPPRDARPQEN